MKNTKHWVLVKTLIPFIFLSGCVILLYYLFFAPKAYHQCVPQESKTVIEFDNHKIPGFVSHMMGIKGVGLNFDKPFYLFVTPNNFIGFVGEIKNATEVDNTFKNTKYVQEYRNNISFAWQKNGWLVAWNKQTFLVIGPGTRQQEPQLRTTVENLFNLKKSNSFTQSSFYDVLAQEKGSCKFYISGNKSPYSIDSLLRLQMPQEIDPSLLISLGTAYDANGQIFVKGVLSLKAHIQKGNKKKIPAHNVFYLGTEGSYANFIDQLQNDTLLSPALQFLDKDLQANKALKGVKGSYTIYVDTIGYVPKFTLYFSTSSNILSQLYKRAQSQASLSDSTTDVPSSSLSLTWKEHRFFLDAQPQQLILSNHPLAPSPQLLAEDTALDITSLMQHKQINQQPIFYILQSAIKN